MGVIFLSPQNKQLSYWREVLSNLTWPFFYIFRKGGETMNGNYGRHKENG